MADMPNRKDLLDEARRLGWPVEGVRRAGEVRVTPPDGQPIRLNNRRKDGTRALRTALRRARKEGDGR